MDNADPLRGARRIMVYGVTGSGKSTTAAKISAATSIPWHSVDDLTWKPGWVEVPAQEQRRIIREICEQPEWIIDAGYGKWLDIPLANVDLIVALDYPRWFSFQRLVRRTIKRIVTRESICNGNRESLRLQLSRDSILVWHWKSFPRKRDRMRQWDDNITLRFTTSRQTRKWISSLRVVSRGHSRDK